MHVDQLIENLKQSSIVEIPLNWGQGRTVYGGLITALMVSHALNRTGFVGDFFI